jgi:hypothetical protein
MKTIHRMCGIAAFALACGGAHAGENYILCGGSPGGLWSLLGSGVDAAVKAVDPESTVTYQTSSGGFANIVQINSGACDLAIVHVAEGLIARKGEAPFTEPTEGFSAVSVMYDWAPMQWVIDADFAAEHGLSSIADLATAKPPIDLVVNRRGILPSTLAEESLKLAGVTLRRHRVLGRVGAVRGVEIGRGDHARPQGAHVGQRHVRGHRLDPRHRREPARSRCSRRRPT